MYPICTVQDRTEIPKSAVPMKFSWLSPVWSEGLYALAMGTCPDCNTLFKNTHSILASGDTFCYSVRTSKCNSVRRRVFFFCQLTVLSLRTDSGQVDKEDIQRMYCTITVSEGIWRSGPQLHLFFSADATTWTLSLWPLHYMPSRNKRQDAYQTNHNHTQPSAHLTFPPLQIPLSVKTVENVDAIYMKLGISLSGRRNVWPVLWPLTGH